LLLVAAEIKLVNCCVTIGYRVDLESSNLFIDRILRCFEIKLKKSAFIRASDLEGAVELEYWS